MTPFEAALRAKYKTPQAAMQALGLDISLLKEDAKMTRRLARDQSPVDANFCLRITTAMLEKLTDIDPAEAARFRAALADLASADTEENLAPRGAQDGAVRGWRAVARGSAPSLRTDPADRPADVYEVLQRSRERTDGSSFACRFPSIARIVNLG